MDMIPTLAGVPKEPYTPPVLIVHDTLRDLTAAGSTQCAPWSTYGTKDQWEAP